MEIDSEYLKAQDVAKEAGLSHGDTADNPDDGEPTDRDGSQGLYLEKKEYRVFLFTRQ